MNEVSASQTVRILHLEDNANDRELVRSSFKAQGVQTELVYATTREEFEDALTRFRFDLILADFALPSYSGMAALELVRGTHPDTPFILCSGTIGEESAVESMKSGATDYVLKDNLSRLGLVVQRALRESGERAERRHAEEALRESQELLLVATQASNVGLWEWNVEGNRAYFSPEWKAQLGYQDDELRNESPEWESRLHPDDREKVLAKLHESLEKPGESYESEYRLRHKDGSYRWIFARGKVFRNRAGKPTRVLGCHLDTTARKLSEQACSASEARFRFLVEQALTGIYVIQEGRLTYVNPKMSEILGFSPHELMSRPVLDFIVEADRSRAVENIRSRMAGETESTHYQLGMRRKDGVDICAEAHGGRAEYNGKPAILGMLLDVSERKKADDALRDSEERYRTLFETMDEGFCVVEMMYDPDGKAVDYRFVEINPAFEKHTGLKQARGRTIRELVPNHEEHWFEIYGNVARYGQTIRFENAATAMEKYFDVLAFQVGGAGSRRVGIFFNDITLRKRAEDRLREQASLLDKAQDAILVRDMEHRVTYWNKSAERLYGWTAEEALGKPAETLLKAEPGAFRQAFELVVAAGEWTGELERVRKDGRTVMVEAHWTLVRDNEGRPASILDINTDITQRKKVEKEMLRAQRMEGIGTIAGGVAHDLNNVLAPILMSLELLKLGNKDGETSQLLRTLQASAQRGADLVKQVLSFARGVEGQRVIVNVWNVLRELDKIAGDTFPKNIKLNLSRGEKVWAVIGDATQLYQVFLNLSVNARDAMPNGGKLTIVLENLVLDEVYSGMNAAAKPGSYVRASVTDTGTGISREVLERIFEPFFTTKEIGKGTGLGLSTTLAIVKSQGGFIDVDSELGKGTTFKVYLPASTTGTDLERAAVEPPAIPRGNSELILVVDDDEAVRVVTQKTLVCFGYQVLLAGNGAEAMAIYAGHGKEIALVLTDMAMPVMDGPSTIIALKVINPQVKIIGSSGFAGNGKFGNAMDAGIEHFLSKPYTAETLLRTLAGVLKTSEPAGQLPGEQIHH